MRIRKTWKMTASSSWHHQQKRSTDQRPQSSLKTLPTSTPDNETIEEEPERPHVPDRRAPSIRKRLPPRLGDYITWIIKYWNMYYTHKHHHCGFMALKHVPSKPYRCWTCSKIQINALKYVPRISIHWTCWFQQTSIRALSLFRTKREKTDWLVKSNHRHCCCIIHMYYPNYNYCLY